MTLYVPKKILKRCVVSISCFLLILSAMIPKTSPSNALPQRKNEVIRPTCEVGMPEVRSIRLKMVPYIPCASPSMNVKRVIKRAAESVDDESER